MLILSRKCLESVIIADRIVVTILGIDGPEVRLGIDAPADVVVMRAEGGPPAATVPAAPSPSVASAGPGRAPR
jgi:carbon storage regulator